MTVPASFATNSCCGIIDLAKHCTKWMAFDCLAAITCLIVGILGATLVVAMSSAVAYSLIGIGCSITLAWIAMVIYICRSNSPGSHNGNRHSSES